MDFEQDSNRRAAKSGFIYAIVTLINAGLVFCSTPIFARIMSQSDFGAYNNFVSWYNILNILSLCLYASFISARRDFGENYDSYVKSMCVLNIIVVLFSFFLFWILKDVVVDLMKMNFLSISLLFLYIMLYQFFLMFQTNERFSFRYKLSSVLTLSCSLLSIVLPWILVSYMRNQYMGRVLGIVIPNGILGLIAFFVLMMKKGNINVLHWKYAIPVCLPFIPHLLSLNLLNSLDKTMISSLASVEYTAIYSIAYTCGSAISLVVGMLNNAFVPWMTEKLQKGMEDEVRNFSKFYIETFQFILIVVLLIAPELVYIIGGTTYCDAIWIMPSIIVGCSMQLIYTMYVNVEQYYKKTKQMAIISAIAAGVNFALNYIFIPQYGYYAAAMTTLVSYCVLAFGHIRLNDILNISIYDSKLCKLILCADICLVFLFQLIYKLIVLRITLTVLILLAFSIICWINRKKIVSIIKIFVR